MVDRQKALLIVLLALLIYPNDIFGKYGPSSFAFAEDFRADKRKSSQRNAHQSSSIEWRSLGIRASRTERAGDLELISEKQDQFDGNLERISDPDPAILERPRKECPSRHSRASLQILQISRAIKPDEHANTWDNIVYVYILRHV